MTFTLFPVAWTLAPGDRLALVVDTVDPRWQSVSPKASTVTLSSTAAAPAKLTLIARRTGG